MDIMGKRDFARFQLKTDYLYSYGLPIHVGKAASIESAL